MPFPFELSGAPLFLYVLSQRLMNMMEKDEELHGYQGVNPVRNSSRCDSKPSGASPVGIILKYNPAIAGLQSRVVIFLTG
jgi:hypothetical protein